MPPHVYRGGLLPPPTTMSVLRGTPQDFQPAPRPKRKWGQVSTTAGTSTSFVSPNQFAVLSDSETDNEENGTQPQTPGQTSRIPPIVLYSFLDNHSATLKKVNEKLSTPVVVKTKTDRLLLYTKTSSDYSILLTEIKSANLAYHTYPLPDAIQPRLVLKGIPPNVPEADIQTELLALNIPVVRISQLTKTDRATNTVLTKYPIFIITFPPATDTRKVLQIRTLCHCLITWEKFKNSRPVRQCFNYQSFGHSSNFCGKPPKCVKCDKPHATKDCTKPVGSPPKCVNCGGNHPANFSGCPRYQQQLQFSQRSASQNLQHTRSAKPSPPTYRYQHSNFPVLQTPHPPPHPPQTWAHIAAQSSNVPNQSSSSTFDSIKSLLTMFDLRKLCAQLRSLALQLQETNDPVAKLAAIIDMIIGCVSASP